MPAPLSTTSSPARDGLRRAARLTAVQRLLVVRVVFAPVLAIFALSFAFFEPTLWRRVVLVAVVCVVLGLSYIEWGRAQRYGIGAVSLPLNIGLMILCQLAVITATGGLFSPLLPAVIVVSFMDSLIRDRGSPPLALVFGVPTVWTLAWAHQAYGLLPVLVGEARGIELGVAPWLAAFVYTAMIVASVSIASHVSDALLGFIGDLMEERDRRLTMHAEQTRALSALSAEIAHELKNPLASVKGLGALLAKGAEGKSVERVAVLRREVDRMQETLESLLNFSRPLVPLSMEQVDARALAEDVARMHEGSAVGRGIRVRVEGGEALVTCDPRKVRQVLVNLVQNAIHASPPGEEVQLAVDGSEESVTLSVLDRGAGLDAAVRESAFEAGVTTKEDGSGIGLVVARSLARQHGGELSLGERGGGGCQAVLTLPRVARRDAA